MTEPRDNGYAYQGGELGLFSRATHWKRYFATRMAPYLRGRVLEVGSGIGTNTPYLREQGDTVSWVCLEPDADLLAATPAREGVATCHGTLRSLPSAAVFDTILYIDVLEHIENDEQEIQAARAHLAPGGRVIILSPAHQKLFSEFDAQVGHFRRYDKNSLSSVFRHGYVCELSVYLDSAGYFLSLVNRLLLRQSMPTLGQVLFWDRVAVRISRLTDMVTGCRFGKSILAVYMASDV